MPRFEPPSLRQGLVGAWCPSLGASGYTLLDRSGNNNHATLTNMGGQSNWQASGNALSLAFDGVDDVAAAQYGSPVKTNRITAAVWYFPLRSNVRNDIFSCWGGPLAPQFLLVANLTGGKLQFYIHDGTASRNTATSSTTLANRTWYHVAGTYDGTSLGLWINGVREVTASITTTMTTAGLSPIRLGNSGVNDAPAQCLLDDARLYDRVLTAAEIRLLASRRGIGLSPLPDRGGGMPRRWSVNVGGTWRQADSYINVGGTWKLAQPSVNVGGTWR